MWNNNLPERDPNPPEFYLPGEPEMEQDDAHDAREAEIRAALQQLEDLTIQQQLVAMQKQSLLDGVLTPEIQRHIADIQAEFAPREDSLATTLTELTANVKRLVAAYGQTVAGQHLQAVWVKGRESWDSRGLQGYARAHPEVLEFQKVGEPSVSIRTVRGAGADSQAGA